MFDTSPYKSILQRYSKLESENFPEAYYILKEATGLSDYYGEELAKAKKLLIQAEFNFKQVKARKSVELSPNKVSEGERLALASDEVKQANNELAGATYVERTLENITTTIDKIYFDSKNIWDKGNKDYRSKERV